MTYVQRPFIAQAGCPQTPLVVCALAVWVSVLAGCSPPAAYREPIARFQQASTVVVEGARLHYGTANQSERNAEIDRRVNAGEEITIRILNDPALRLLGPDDLRARMNALDALSKHGQLLLALSSSDAPTRAKDAANSLDNAIVALATSLNANLSQGPFKAQADGFVAIAAEVTELVLEAKISAALDKAIVASEAEVTALIGLLQMEMGALYERRRSKLGTARVQAIDEYKLELAKTNPSLEKLRKAADQIKQVEDEWDSLPLLLGAGPGLNAMAQAHQQLVAYARSKKSPQDLADLIEAIDAFVIRAKVIADASRAIRDAKDEP